MYLHNFFPYVKKMPAGYYQKSKEKTWERYQDLFEEQKNRKCHYVCECYKNHSEDEKQRLVEYRKNYFKMPKVKTLV